MTTAIRSQDSLLRGAIRYDATGVGVMGLAMAALAGPFARMTGLTPTHAFIAGGAFVVYGVLGNYLAGRRAIRPIGTGFTIFNFVGAAAQIAVAAAGLLSLTSAGKAVLVFGGLWALLFGVLQLAGVRRLG